MNKSRRKVLLGGVAAGLALMSAGLADSADADSSASSNSIAPEDSLMTENKALSDLAIARVGKNVASGDAAEARTQLKSYSNDNGPLRTFDLHNQDAPSTSATQSLAQGILKHTGKFSQAILSSQLPIVFQSAVELAGRIRRREISSVELTKLYLDRLDRYGHELNAVVTIMHDHALAQARHFDEELSRGIVRSPLHGVPYGIKDLFSTRSAPTTWGSKIYENRTINEDAAVVEKLSDAGCPLLAKLSMVEFAGSVGYRYASASLSGPGRTPWDSSRWAGGSSSGSGAATAAGLVGFAIGTETWGSIVCPAGFCGVAGLRSTFGRVSRAGAMALSWTMDKIGPLARTVEDTAIILSLIAGDDKGRDLGQRLKSESEFILPQRMPSLKSLRVGIVEPTYGKGVSSRAVKPAFEKALAVLQELGVHAFPVKLPSLPTDEAAIQIVEAEGASAFKQIGTDPKLLSQVIDPEMRGGLIARAVTPAVDYISALRVRALAQREVQTLFEKVDVLIAPSLLQVPPPIEANLDTYFTGSDAKLSGLGNLLGLPALSVPMALVDGILPLGIQFVGAPLAEENLLALGAAFEQTTGLLAKMPAKYAH